MIEIKDLWMTYRSGGAEHLAVGGVSLTVEAGEFFTLLGPSGCGKTTTLRCVAGLERPDSGEISIGGQVVFSSSRNIWVPAHARKIGMVFQSYAIWPHMTVFDNVAFPLRQLRPRPSRREIRERVREALVMVQLGGLEERPAPFLSGGQQQRLALARALVHNPNALLLDEPLSNLDAKLREEMRTEIRRLVERLNLTTLFVTHEQIEALTMSDIVGVMHDGQIVQSAPPLDIYFNPTGPFVADFIGKSNFISATIRSFVNGGRDFVAVDSPLGPLTCRCPGELAVGDSVLVVVRPEHVTMGSAAAGQEENALSGSVAGVSFLGNLMDCVVKVGDQYLRMQISPHQAPDKGQSVALRLPAEHCFAIRAG